MRAVVQDDGCRSVDRRDGPVAVPVGRVAVPVSGMSWVVWLLAWLGLSALAVVNGIARDALYLERLGERRAHQVATVVLLLLMLGYTWLVHQRWPLPGQGAAWQVGLVWLVLTVAFEVGLGRLQGRSWAELLASYDLLSGNLWVLVPLATLVLPPVVRWMSGQDT